MMQKKSQTILILFVILIMVPSLVLGQYKSADISIPGLTQSSTTGSPSIFGLDLSKIDFHNSYSMQVSSFGDNAVAMGLLKSSFNYAVNPQVTVQGYVGLVHSPFGSVAPFGEQASFMNGLSKENIMYGGEVIYQPRENVFFHIGFSRLPSNPYQQQYSTYPFLTRGY